MRRTFHTRTSHALAAVAAIGTMLAGAQTTQADEWSGLRVFGLTDDGRLVRFRADSPRRTRNLGFINGLAGTDSTLIGIDFRVQDGKLYGVGNGGGVYTIDTTTAQATFVNALTVPLSGNVFGVDFNPAADRLRIISDMGQNLAHNVNAGGVTASNSALTYTAPPATPATALGITATAYTNNDLDPATATTLFDLDTTLDQADIQSPPGAGILVATGKLGFDAAPQAGFDIYSRTARGVTIANRALASLIVSGQSGFYLIELTTGRAVRLGTLGEMVLDIAIPLNQAVGLFT